MVLDADLIETNKYTVELIGSTYNLVTIQSVNKFKVAASVCSGEVKGFNFTADCTVLTPRMYCRGGGEGGRREGEVSKGGRKEGAWKE